MAETDAKPGLSSGLTTRKVTVSSPVNPGMTCLSITAPSSRRISQPGRGKTVSNLRSPGTERPSRR